MFPTLDLERRRLNDAFLPGGGGGFGGGGSGVVIGGGSGTIWPGPGTITIGGSNGPGGITIGGGGGAGGVGYATPAGWMQQAASFFLGIDWGRIAAFVLGLLLIAGGIFLIKQVRQTVVVVGRHAARAAEAAGEAAG